MAVRWKGEGVLLTCGINVEQSRMCRHQSTEGSCVRCECLVSSVDFGMKMGKVGSGAEQTQQHMGLGRIPSSCLVVECDKQRCDDEVQGIRHLNPGKDQLRAGQVPA